MPKVTNGIKHVGAYCVDCEKWLRWLPADNEESVKKIADEGLQKVGEFVLTFGKFKGKKLSECTTDYLKWIVEKHGDKLLVERAAIVLNGKYDG